MSLSPKEFQLIRDYVRKECALEIGDDKHYLIESRLTPIMRDIGATGYEEFYRKIHEDHSHKLRDRIIDAITTHETLWFRDSAPWRVMEEVILPNFAEQINKREKLRIRIWSAACSTGQEPYSLAMLIDHNISLGKLRGLRPEHIEIVASDVSPTAVETAEKGHYRELEINRGLKEPYKSKYFRKDGTGYLIDDKIRRRVKYRVFNLQDNFLSLGRMDLILCRNVLIYFSDDFKSQLMRRFAMTLNPGGYFLLGSTESGLGHSHTFEMKDHNHAIYYQLKSF